VQDDALPHDGNGLLGYCNVVVISADNPATLTSLSSDAFSAQMMKFAWCSGYLQAVHDAATSAEVNVYLISKLGVTLAGPDKAREYAFNTLRGVCIPEKVPLLQLARVVVKWLHEHPEKLQEPINGLVTDAINDAFPCTPVTTPEPAKPQDVKPAVAKPSKP
jgi:Rap1a immunity proteins